MAAVTFSGLVHYGFFQLDNELQVLLLLLKVLKQHLKVLLNSFHLNGHTVGYHLKSEIHFVQHNKQYHMKVLLNSFHFNGHTLGFYPQT